MDFFQTRMGRIFYEATMPQLVKELSRLNSNIEKVVEARNNTPAPLPCMLCQKCQHYNAGEFYPGCRECLSGGSYTSFLHMSDTRETSDTGTAPKVTDIDWDVDSTSVHLPSEVALPNRFVRENFESNEQYIDAVADWLSSEFGYCPINFVCEELAKRAGIR